MAFVPEGQADPSQARTVSRDGWPTVGKASRLTLGFGHSESYFQVRRPALLSGARIADRANVEYLDVTLYECGNEGVRGLGSGPRACPARATGLSPGFQPGFNPGYPQDKRVAMKGREMRVPDEARSYCRAKVRARNWDVAQTPRRLNRRRSLTPVGLEP
jgi:hypothetical protein